MVCTYLHKLQFCWSGTSLVSALMGNFVRNCSLITASFPGLGSGLKHRKLKFSLCVKLHYHDYVFIVGNGDGDIDQSEEILQPLLTTFPKVIAIVYFWFKRTFDFNSRGSLGYVLTLCWQKLYFFSVGKRCDYFVISSTDSRSVLVFFIIVFQQITSRYQKRCNRKLMSPHLQSFSFILAELLLFSYFSMSRVYFADQTVQVEVFTSL